MIARVVHAAIYTSGGRGNSGRRSDAERGVRCRRLSDRAFCPVRLPDTGCARPLTRIKLACASRLNFLSGEFSIYLSHAMTQGVRGEIGIIANYECD